MEEWAIWRLVTEKIATLKEIDEHWSLEDIDKANAVLDMRREIERLQSEKRA
jgi:hypothetical protein